MILYKAIMILSLLTGNMTGEFSSNRQLLIFGKEENQLFVQKQLQLLDSATDGVKERAIKTIVLEKDSPLLRKYQVKPGQFTIILIGKDGTEKYRTNKLLQIQDLFAIIDAMPMRKAEMGKQQKEG